MDDTVTWKIQSKVEDDHEVAEYFINSCTYWIDCILIPIYHHHIMHILSNLSQFYDQPYI